MRITKYPIFTSKNIFSNIESTSYRLMLRSGMIRKSSKGIYIWLPIGIRVLNKVISLIKKYMNSIDAIELMMPIMQPEYLWKKSGRLKISNLEIMSVIDRKQIKYILGPTNEEVILNLVHNEIHSYKNLPTIFYQIQYKFRDEIRPCLGVIRSREFIMKDAYSFHSNKFSLQKTYNKIFHLYKKIFDCMKINFFVAQADTGFIGGDISHEFYARKINNFSETKNFKELKLIKIPNINSIDELSNKLHISIKKIVKVIIIRNNNLLKYNSSLLALVIRADKELNLVYISKILNLKLPIKLATENDIKHILKINNSIIGVLNLSIPIIIDYDVANMKNFVTSNNIHEEYLINVNWGKDLILPEIKNLCNKNVNFNNQTKNDAIEIAHIFQLGTKYSHPMKVYIKKDNNKTELIMGCYGIGITRLIAAVIEQNNDQYGIKWPPMIAPFNVALLPINFYSSIEVKNTTEYIYKKLLYYNVDTLLYDRKEYFGVMLHDIELIGIPNILIISKSNLNKGIIEYKDRINNTIIPVNSNNIVQFLLRRIKNII
ncbi:MAG: His/Gly/Thr/Pro-type tRNA ligase C-terminal domain-containing protein [Candidatus Lightella neohaematopini]|nr:His/Gly/Thr/Pro-type tRNA ligase C-terminal domain-containing protein [Candidatus Lightella neohaematopini]